MTIFKTYFFIALCAFSLLTVSSCGEDVPEDQQLMEFFEKNNITPQVTASGLFYVIDEPGTAEKPTAQSSVTVHYKGYHLNGDQFDSSYDSLKTVPSSFCLVAVRKPILNKKLIKSCGFPGLSEAKYPFTLLESTIIEKSENEELKGAPRV